MTDSYTASGISSDEDTLEVIGARYVAAKDHLALWREEARKCYDFYASRQWTEADKQVLLDQTRPVITFNRAGKMIDAVLGHENNNRNEIRYIPRTDGDAKVDEVLTQVAQFFLDQCDGEDEQSDAFRDMLISGMGWTGTRIDDEASPEGDLIVERVDPLEMLYDPSAKKPNIADARYLFREKRMSYEEAKAAFPDWSGDYTPAEWAQDDDTDGNPKAWTKFGYTGNSNQTQTPHRNILVLEYQCRDVELRYMVANTAQNDDGSFVEPEPANIDSETYNENKDKIDKAKFEVATKKKVTYRRKFLIGREIVHEDEVCPTEFTYQAITGKRDREKNHWFGLMRLLMDPQMWSNKWLSQMLHIINVQAKGGLMVEKGSVESIADLEASWAKTGAVNVFQDGALRNNSVVQKEIPQFPVAIFNILEYANESFGDVSGINAELLGMADREQPGVLEWQRKQSAVTLLAPLFDSLRRYRKMFGRCWLYFIQRYMARDIGRIVRITVDDQSQAMQIAQLNIGDPDVARYDVVVDQAATAPNQKEATWSVLTSIFPFLQDVIAGDPELILLFLEQSPLPESFVEKLKEHAQQKAQQGPPPNPEMMKAQAQIEGQKQKMQLDQQAQQQKAQMDAVQLQQQMQADQAQTENAIRLEQMKAAAQLQIQREKNMADIEMAQAKASSDLQISRQKSAVEMALMEKSNAVDNTVKAETTRKQSAQQGDLTAAVIKAITKPKKILRDKGNRISGIE